MRGLCGVVNCVTLAIEAMREEQLMGYQLGREKYVPSSPQVITVTFRIASMNLGSHTATIVGWEDIKRWDGGREMEGGVEGGGGGRWDGGREMGGGLEGGGEGGRMEEGRWREGWREVGWRKGWREVGWRKGWREVG